MLKDLSPAATIVQELHELKDQAQQLKDLIDSKQSELIGLLGAGTHECGDSTVSISQAQRIDPKALAEDFPHDDFPEIWSTPKPTVDVKKAKGELPPATLQAYSFLAAPSVKIKRKPQADNENH